ncbi:MAG TPA: hydroxymethylbilane synthase [Gammaproteobacteria bacterium]|nr:hydroxymethylbilane synthase [Gammaproteobacteria bacterium]
MKKKTLVIATRESPLALWQATWVKTQLEKNHPKLAVTLLGVTTSADQLLSMPLYKVGGKGLFVKELEEALFDGRADIAVHSMKDVPMVLPEGLCIGALSEREDPRDAFVSNHYSSARDLPEKAMVGTSSLRRQSQLLASQPQLETHFLRGNIQTRLSKLDEGQYAAIILAAAGLKRLGLSDRIRSFMTLDEMLPAAGQGVLGIECRVDDQETLERIAPLNDGRTRSCVLAERAMCRHLGGGCHVPIAAYAEWQDDQLRLRGLVANPRGTVLLRAELTGSALAPDTLGVAVAEELVRQGARPLLDAIDA